MHITGMAQRRRNFECRNLPKSQLGGVVFGCTKNTFKECMSKQLFGLPRNHITYVQKIDTGLPLFLFNYSDRKLHGIFEAAGPGQLLIDPYGWTSNGSEKTFYPAQVRINVQSQCEPLTEDKFKPAIEANYYHSHHFYFELDHQQTTRLLCLLRSFALKPKPPLSSSTSQRRQVFHFPPLNETKEKNSDDEVQPSTKLDIYTSEDHHPDVEKSKEIDKGYVLEKLKDLAALTHGHDEDNSVMKTVEQNDVEDRDEVVDEEETCSEEKRDDSSLVSSSCEPTLSQLMQEVKELKANGLVNSTKICYLEEKLDEAHKEIRRLRERCNMLESVSNAKGGFIDNMEIHSPEDDVDDSSLDPNEAILLLGGYNADSKVWLSSAQSYFPSRNVVKAHSSMDCTRSNFAVAKLDDRIYIFGGDDGTRDRWYYDTVESYNQSDGRWSSCPSLAERKVSLGGATLNGKIFAIGGGNGVVSFSDVEMLDPDIGKWIKTSSMEQKRFAVASLEHNGSIYAVGGFDGKEYMNTAERFDPREHSWMRIASMKTRRGCHSLAVLNEKLYAIGGYDGSKMVSSVEIYEPRKGTWIDGEPMKEFRGYSGAVVVNESIYVIGGYKGEDEDNILDTVECFKEGEGWRNVRCSSIGKRCFLSAVSPCK